MDHPNIVPLLGVWMDSSPQISPLPGFVMPLMDGDMFHYLHGKEGRATPIIRRMQYVSSFHMNRHLYRSFKLSNH